MTRIAPIEAGAGMILNSCRTKDHHVTYHNQTEYHKICHEIYDQNEYYFDSRTPAPFIIDCGAHIGLATLYFKQLYPNAQILAFEPDRRNVRLIEMNIEYNKLEGIQLIHAAVWSEDGHAPIYFDQEILGDTTFTWGNSLIHNIWGDADGAHIEYVPTVRLSNYLTRDVDFLKIDIEGSEETVIREIREFLPRIGCLAVEYHGTDLAQHVNDIGRIVEIMEDAQFDVSIEAKSVEGLFTKEQMAAVRPRLATVRARNKRWQGTVAQA